MLRQQHRFTKLNRCTRHWQGYRLHMCGLCHALGDGYGHLSRLLTSRELILLNMLVSAQLPEMATTERRCPLNPMMHVQTNVSVASEFSAAMAIKLTEASVADDVQDEGGFVPHLANLALKRPVKNANTTLEKLAFSTRDLNQLTEKQTLAESRISSQPEIPSANLSADIFGMTATLAHLPDNAPYLAEIGQAYGATIYWMDAYLDFAQDMQSGAFNPLREYAEQPSGKSNEGYVLALDGLHLLHAKFSEYERIIQDNLAGLTLYRYRPDLETLLLEPLDRVRTELNQLIQQKRALHFKPRQTGWQLASLMALVFAILGLSFTQYEPDFPDDSNPRRKRRRDNVQQSWFDDCCYSASVFDCEDCGNCCHCCHEPSLCKCCCNCGTPCDNCDGGCCNCGGGCCDCGGCDCDCD